MKLNLKASFFKDLLISFINVYQSVDNKTGANVVRSVAEKLVTFLNNTSEFQGLTVDQKAIIVTRNVPTVIRFMSMTVEWIGEGEDQLIFLRRLLTSFSGTDVFLKYIKPERFSFKTAHAKHGNVFISDEHEKEFDEVMKNLRQFESLTIFDMEMFAVAILFHTENQENMPNINAYRSFLLKTLREEVSCRHMIQASYHPMEPQIGKQAHLRYTHQNTWRS